LTFELSKVETAAIRERMVSHLLNIDETLATTVAEKLGFQSMPKPADAAMPTRQDLKPSPALSIVENGPKRFEGRKLGVLVTDGVDAKLLKGLMTAITKEKAVFELIAPKIGGVTASDGTWVEAHHTIDGGPSVLFDAIALLTSTAAIDDLLKEAAARDFVADAFQHCKYIGYDQSALPLLEKVGIADAFDEGILALPGEDGLSAFVSELGKLRVWGREPAVKLGNATPPIK
jgi:catalase